MFTPAIAKETVAQLTKTFTPSQLAHIDLAKPAEQTLADTKLPATPQLTNLLANAQALNIKVLPVQYVSSDYARIIFDLPFTTTQGAFLATYYEDTMEEDTNWTGDIMDGREVTQTIICPPVM